jgi:hypothetical protein
MVRFWEWLESRPDRTAALDEWQQVLGGGESRSVAQRFLKPLETPSTAYPTSRRRGFPLNNACQRDGIILAKDEVDGQDSKKLLVGGVVRYRLCLHALRSSLCDALNRVCVSRTQIEPNACSIQIGNWEPKKSAMFPVHLLICPSPHDLQFEVFRQIVFSKRPGAILLTPTRMHWLDETLDAARLHNTILVPLTEVLVADGDTLRQTPDWEEYLQGFAQMVRLKLPSNYNNTKPLPMRGTRAANIERLERELQQHLLAARDHAYALIDAGHAPELLPRPEQNELARRLGVPAPAVYRCLTDPRAKLLKILWDAAQSLESVMQFKSIRRR